MATIPEYQRQNLKSSQVGTAGADYSTGQAFDSVAQNAGRVADSAMDLAVKRKAAKDEAIANESTLAMDIDMENALRQHQNDMKNFEGDPKARAMIYQGQADNILQARLKSAPNDQVRRTLLDQGTQMIKSRTNREIRDADANQGVIAYTKVNDAQKLAETEMAKVGADENLTLGQKMARWTEVTDQYNGTLSAASKVLNPLQAQELDTNGKGALAKAAASGLLAKKPEELLALLKPDKNGKTVFDGKIPPAEIEKLRKDALSSLSHFEERKIRDDMEAHLNQVSDTFSLAQKGDNVAALAMAEQLPDGKLKDGMRQSILREGITEADRNEKVVDLATKFSTMIEDRERNTKGKGAKKKVNMKTSLQQIIDFQAEVVEAHATGDITDAVRNKYLVEFLPELQKKTRQQSFNIQNDPNDTGMNWFAKSWRGINKIIPDKVEAVSAHQEFQQRLAMGRDFSAAGANKAMLATLRNHQINRFPQSLFLAGTANAVLDNNKGLVASGVQGRTDLPVSGKVPPVGNTRIGTDSAGNKFKVTFDENGNELNREAIPRA